MSQRIKYKPIKGGRFETIKEFVNPKNNARYIARYDPIKWEYAIINVRNGQAVKRGIPKGKKIKSMWVSIKNALKRLGVEFEPELRKF